MTIETNITITFSDYFELTKPKVVALMILTSVIGMFLAVPGMVPLDVLILGNLGIALCAGSAAAVNHLVDRQIDIKMARTRNRPIATGRVDPVPASIFAFVIGALGTWILVAFINVITAVLHYCPCLVTLWFTRSGLNVPRHKILSLVVWPALHLLYLAGQR